MSKLNKKQRIANMFNKIDFDNLDIVSFDNSIDNSVSYYNDDKIVYETSLCDKNNKLNKNNKSDKNNKNNSLNTSNKNVNTITKQKPIFKENNLIKLFNKKLINLDQLYAGIQLKRDYENSFVYYRSPCISPIVAGRSSSKKFDSTKFIINNITTYNRYHNAIKHLNNIKMRFIVYNYCIEESCFTYLDKQLKSKTGTAEILLHYGLLELSKFYKEERKIEKTEK